MQKIVHRSITLLVLAVLVATSLVAGCQSSSGTIVVATDATWPPMEYVDENKAIVGYDIDLMKAVAEEAGIEIEAQERGLGRHLCRTGCRRV